MTKDKSIHGIIVDTVMVNPTKQGSVNRGPSDERSVSVSKVLCQENCVLLYEDTNTIKLKRVFKRVVCGCQ